MIRIVSVGKIGNYLDLVNNYLKRIKKVEVIDFKESDVKSESSKIIELIKGYSILLDIEGKLVSSEKMSEIIKKKSLEGDITFIIGGSNGVTDSLKSKVDFRMSLGKITLPHKLARLVLVEQIYRAYTIIEGKKYHK